MVITASERMAGCLAKMSVPMPMNIITAEIITLLRLSLRVLRPVAYSCISPSVMKIV